MGINVLISYFIVIFKIWVRHALFCLIPTCNSFNSCIYLTVISLTLYSELELITVGARLKAFYQWALIMSALRTFNRFPVNISVLFVVH